MKINLLPWRENQTYWLAKRNLFTLLSISILMTGFFIWLNHFLNDQLTSAKKTNLSIKKELEQQKPHHHEALNSLQKIVKFAEALRLEQRLLLTIFAAIEQAKPNDLMLHSINHQQGGWELMGETNRITLAHQFIENFNRHHADLFIQIKQIQHHTNSSHINFVISLKCPSHEKQP